MGCTTRYDSIDVETYSTKTCCNGYVMNKQEVKDIVREVIKEEIDWKGKRGVIRAVILEEIQHLISQYNGDDINILKQELDSYDG